MSYSPIGDTIAVTNLAYSVYSNVYLVARDAPDQFGEISRDMKIFKSILYQVRDQVNRDIDSTYGTDIQDVLRRCFDTLRGLRDLTAKYEKLGTTLPDLRLIICPLMKVTLLQLGAIVARGLYDSSLL